MTIYVIERKDKTASAYSPLGQYVTQYGGILKTVFTDMTEANAMKTFIEKIDPSNASSVEVSFQVGTYLK